MSIVSLQKCKTYDHAELKRAIHASFKLIGFDLNSLRYKRVALKPNLLMPFSPERAVTTNPEFFRAVAGIVREYTHDVVIIESPNFFPLESTMRKAGLHGIVRKLGIQISDINEIGKLSYQLGVRYKTFEISKDFFDVDCIINLPKLKTHGFTHFSGAVKNLFGVMPGLRKSRMHMRAPSQMEFSQFLLDLYGGLLFGFEKKKKIIHIMDAVIGMEGEGPGPSGKPKEIGAVIASDDAIALDFVAAKLVGLNENKIFTITEGFKRGYGAQSPDQIRVKGESIEEMRIDDFVPAKSVVMSGIVWPMTSPTVKNLFVEKPVPSAELCSLCMHCRTVCPADAIEKVEGRKTPRFNYRTCIRCYCCLETCPESAISLQKGKLQRLMKT